MNKIKYDEDDKRFTAKNKAIWKVPREELLIS